MTHQQTNKQTSHGNPLFERRAMKLAAAALFLGATPSTSFQPSSLTRSATKASHQLSLTTSLHGKLWKRLNIEESSPEIGTQWYLINCVAGVEFDLLNMAREVTKDFCKFSIDCAVSLGAFSFHILHRISFKKSIFNITQRLT